MARKNQVQDSELDLVESTGAVEFDASPVTVEQSADNSSTDAVPFDASHVTIVASHFTDDVVVHVPTTGPETFTVAGLPGIRRKVVTAPEPAGTEATTAAEVKTAEPAGTEATTAAEVKTAESAGTEATTAAEVKTPEVAAAETPAAAPAAAQ